MWHVEKVVLQSTYCRWICWLEPQECAIGSYIKTKQVGCQQKGRRSVCGCLCLNVTCLHQEMFLKKTLSYCHDGTTVGEETPHHHSTGHWGKLSPLADGFIPGVSWRLESLDSYHIGTIQASHRKNTPSEITQRKRRPRMLHRGEESPTRGGPIRHLTVKGSLETLHGTEYFAHRVATTDDQDKVLGKPYNRETGPYFLQVGQLGPSERQIIAMSKAKFIRLSLPVVH